MSYTPGPWAVGHATNYGTHNPNIVYSSGSGESVATVYGIPMHTDLEKVEKDERSREGLANARLIAASPDLLDALKAVDAFASSPWSLSANHDAVLSQVRAAIQKAEGKS